MQRVWQSVDHLPLTVYLVERHAIKNDERINNLIGKHEKLTLISELTLKRIHEIVFINRSYNR